jgi:ABC-type branched-subunit amino acid transport system substrate-binding protein
MRHAAIKGPFVGTDALFDGWPQGTDTALSDSDARAGDILLAFPGGGESSVMARFRDRYRAQVGGAAPAFAATGYACVEVIQQALEMADSVALTDGLAVREAVRAAVAGDNTFTTILGPLRFDGNGDTVPQTVSIYKFDPDLHDWTFVTSIDT